MKYATQSKDASDNIIWSSVADTVTGGSLVLFAVQPVKNNRVGYARFRIKNTGAAALTDFSVTRSVIQGQHEAAGSVNTVFSSSSFEKSDIVPDYDSALLTLAAGASAEIEVLVSSQAEIGFWGKCGTTTTVQIERALFEVN